MKNHNHIYHEEEKQLSELQQRIEAEIAPDIHLKLKIHISNLTSNFVNDIMAPFQTISETRVALLDEMNRHGNTENIQNVLSQYYKNFDPSPVYNNLKHTLSVNPLIKEYQKFITGLSQMEGVNKVVHHHQVDEKTFKEFQSGINEISQPMFKLLGKHTKNLKDYGYALKQVKETNKVHRKERRMTGIMTAVIAGPIPALIARGIASNLTELDSEQKTVAITARKVEDDWIEGVEGYLTRFEANLRKRYSLITYVLFGGMLLKINEDIKKYGYEMHTFDWRTVQGTIRLSGKNTETISTWTDSSLSKIDSMMKNNDDEGAKLIAEYLSTFLKSKRTLGRYEYMPEGMNVSLPLLDIMKNKRLNVHLFSIDKSQWKERKFNKALDSYLDIMTSYETFDTHHDLITDVPLPVAVIARIIAITEANHDNIYADHIHHYFYTDPMAHELYTLYRNYRFSESINRETIDYRDEIKAYYLQTLQEIGLDDDIFYDYLNEKEGLGPLVEEAKLEHSVFDKLLNSKILGGMTLTKAIQDNNIAKIKKLIHKNEVIDTRNSQSPFITAIKYENHLAFDLILQNDFDINFSDESGNTPLHHVVQVSDSKMLNSLIKQKNIDLNKQNNKGMTPLMLAACQNDIDIVQRLLDKHADYAIKDNEDISPLFASMIRGNFAIAELLLPHSDVDERSEYHGRVSMLMYAARVNHEEMVALLLSKGADPNIADEHGNNILTHTIQGGMNKNVLKNLAKYGADLDYINPINGNSPLIEAVLTGNTEAAEALVNSGVNLNIMNYEGETALIAAEGNAHFHLKNMLLEKGAIAL